MKRQRDSKYLFPAGAEGLAGDPYALLDSDLNELLSAAASCRDQTRPRLVTYSPKVFIPLTKLCRDVCHYCTFAEAPKKGQRAYLLPEEVLDIARAGEAAGCHEALFTLGDQPEDRYEVAREELATLGYNTTVDYLVAMCQLVLDETALLPHANPGVMSADQVAALREVSVSQGLMLESVAERLCERGGPHFGSPDKRPEPRLETIRLAGEASVPFTTGILIGIGETRRERIDALLAIRVLHQRYDHIQEVIIQNFRAKPGTKMVASVEPSLDELKWTVAVARLIFGSRMNIQAPPNLTPNGYPLLLAAGINDWGGVSPVTRDHVNPEAPWPALSALRLGTGQADKVLVPRLPIYPEYLADPERWLAPGLVTAVTRSIDTMGLARPDTWVPGDAAALPDMVQADMVQADVAQTNVIQAELAPQRIDPSVEAVLAQISRGSLVGEQDLVTLFAAHGADFDAVCRAADDLRKAANGEVVSYVVNRNINYTNVCSYRCQFCAFSKGKLSESLRGSPYDLELNEITRRAEEAWQRGATEVCLQGGIHPDYTGNTYLSIVRAIKDLLPDMHVHAFSPLEIWQGASTLKLSLNEYLSQLRDAGLGTLPGTAAEILDDEVRADLCPDKLSSEQWLEVMSNAHALGLRTTSTIMFGHIDDYTSWARHLLRLRELQIETGGFTELVPLPFVHMEAPIYLKGKARRGPTFREVVLMHAVARLALHPYITNIQTSWTKLGVVGAQHCLNAGANDLGGTLMNESISRAAGSEHGQELSPESLETLIEGIGRTPLQRTTLYKPTPPARRALSFAAPELAQLVQSPASKYARVN